MAKKILSVLVLMTMVVSFAAAQDYSNDPAVGVWMSIDDDGETPTGYWELYLDEGKLFGKLIYAIGESVESKLSECTKDSYAGHPVAGSLSALPLLDTVLMYNMQYREPGYWWKGRIIDPEDGKLYYVKVFMDKEEMVMKGSIDKRGLLGRKQVWRKSTMERALDAKANLE